MKEIKVEFEKYDGTISSFIQNAKDGEKYLLRMVSADGSDNVRIELCEVCGSMSGMFALIGGKFHFDWSDMRVAGICKILCD